MKKINVNIDQVLRLKKTISEKSNTCNDCGNRIETIKNNISRKVLNRRNINSRLMDLRSKINRQSAMLNSLSRVLGNVANDMVSTDDRIKSKAMSLVYRLNTVSIVTNIMNGPNPRSRKTWSKDLSKYTYVAELFGGKVSGVALSSKPFLEAKS